MDAPHIVIVTDNGHINGGSGRVALSSARLLADEGYRVTLFCAVGPIEKSLLDDPNIEVVCLEQHDILSHPNRLAAMAQGIWNGDARGAFASLLAPLRPTSTIVHVHSWTKALSSSVIQLALANGFPLVVTLHDYFSVCPTGSLFNHVRQEKCELAPMGLRCLGSDCDPRSYRQKLWRIVRQGVQASFGKMPNGVRHFITISAFSERLLRPHLESDDTIFHRVPNMIDIAQDSAATPAEHDAFLFLGRFSPEKGPVLFARAARAVGVRARFVGTGECEPAIRMENPEAELLGWLDQERSLHALREARALVFPSLWYETLGLTVLEAMALGVPVVVPSNSACAEEVEDDRTGLIFTSGDEGALSETLRRLATDDALVERLGRTAYARFWEAPPTPQRHVAALRAVYEQALRC